MNFDPPLECGTLLRRYKRFLADVRCEDGTRKTMHCANTGAMLGCSDPGSPVWYSTSSNKARKYANSLELVETEEKALVCVNTARANQLVGEALASGAVSQFRDHEPFKAEIAIPNESGRFDFGNSNTMIEVKSVTWCRDGIGAFPDAVSERAQKHVDALAACAQSGFEAVLLFCVPHTGIETVTVAREIDPKYCEAVDRAVDLGVSVIAYGCQLNASTFLLDRELPVRL